LSVSGDECYFQCVALNVCITLHMVSGKCAFFDATNYAKCTEGRHTVKGGDIALNGKFISELRSVTCHMGSHSVTYHLAPARERTSEQLAQLESVVSPLLKKPTLNTEDL